MRPTQTIILAAGLGSRLGALTAGLPKALIAVGGRPLIDYALAFARRAAGPRQIVVGGFHHEELAARVATLAPDATLRENRAFRLGNLLSMRVGARALEPEAGFLLMNTDHVYHPAIAERVARSIAQATEVTAFCDVDRPLGADDMKVALDAAGRVADMAKTLRRWDRGYVGLTFVPAPRVAAYLAAGECVLAARGDLVHVETVLVALAAAGTPPRIADVSGHGWLEVDEPHERDHADSVLTAERWWAVRSSRPPAPHTRGLRHG